jgi:hypothetical protein
VLRFFDLPSDKALNPLIRESPIAQEKRTVEFLRPFRSRAGDYYSSEILDRKTSASQELAAARLVAPPVFALSRRSTRRKAVTPGAQKRTDFLGFWRRQ